MSKIRNLCVFAHYVSSGMMKRSKEEKYGKVCNGIGCGYDQQQVHSLQ